MSSPGGKSPAEQAQARYDRQLRLWGEAGQAALEAGHVCLVNATALGTETLKAVVLGGVGAVTVLDERLAGDEDVGGNFFLEAASRGLERGAEALRLLLELNPAVQGRAVRDSPDLILQENPDFFRSFGVVVATALSEKTARDLSDLLWELDVPFILCRSVGFLGSFRVQLKEHAVVETHPDNEQPDLRLDVPFQSLSEYLDGVRLEELELKDHAHIPWLIVLYKALKLWSSRNDGRWPHAWNEKNEIRNIIRDMIKKDENGVPAAEENFEEAIRAVNTALTPTALPPKVKDILHNHSAINLTSKSTPFWIMCSALRGYVEAEGNGFLPVRGVIPDMTASTDYYINLQNIYRAKAASDAEAVYRRVQQIVLELKCESISESDVKSFCRHAQDLYLVKGTQISQEYVPGSTASSYIARHLEEPDVMMVHYILLRAAEKFKSEHGRAPGDWELEGDISKLKNCVSKLLSDVSCNPFPKDDHVHEMCRYGGAEIHSVSAFMGGCVAQEVIKLITKQFVPVNNTFIHDAASTNSTVFTF